MAELDMQPLPHILVDEPPMRLFVSRSRPDAMAVVRELDRAFESLVAEGVVMDVTRR